jgi:hypothetical protein
LQLSNSELLQLLKGLIYSLCQKEFWHMVQIPQSLCRPPFLSTSVFWVTQGKILSSSTWGATRFKGHRAVRPTATHQGPAVLRTHKQVGKDAPGGHPLLKISQFNFV